MIVLAIIALILAAIPCAMVLRNLSLYRPPRPGIHLDEPAPAISVLIPARNEAKNIRACVQSVLVNRHADIEVIVLDDHSQDGTGALVLEMAKADRRVRLATAPALPAGWNGKTHACQVLSGLATKPLLVFLDADVRLAPNALDRMAAFLKESGADLVSGIPRQETKSWAEALLIPLIHFVLLGLLPFSRMRSTRKPAYGSAIGQLLMVRADAYATVGGHSVVRASLHDGLLLARAFRAADLVTDLFDATTVASCRMYNNAQEVFSGLAKNAVEGLAAPRLIGLITVLLLGGQVLPWVLLGVSPAGPERYLAGVGVALSLLPRLLMATRFQQSWTSALLHPLGICVLLGIQWYALLQHLRRRPRMWKGRSYA
jgi:hypothetical protein